MMESLSNRWFVWALVFIVVVGISLWAFIQQSIIEMDVESLAYAYPI